MVSAVWDQSPTSLTLTFDRPMDTSRTGAAGSFVVADQPWLYTANTTRTWLDDRTLRIAGWEEPDPGGTGNTWSYTPLSNPIRAADGVLLAAITDAPYTFAS